MQVIFDVPVKSAAMTFASKSQIKLCVCFQLDDLSREAQNVSNSVNLTQYITEVSTFFLLYFVFCLSGLVSPSCLSAC